MLQRGSEVHQPLHRKPFQLVVLQGRNLRLIHPQHLRRLRVYTETTSGIRLIGARVATATEKRQYEEVS